MTIEIGNGQVYGYDGIAMPTQYTIITNQHGTSKPKMTGQIIQMEGELDLTKSFTLQREDGSTWPFAITKYDPHAHAYRITFSSP